MGERVWRHRVITVPSDAIAVAGIAKSMQLAAGLAYLFFTERNPKSSNKKSKGNFPSTGWAHIKNIAASEEHTHNYKTKTNKPSKYKSNPNQTNSQTVGQRLKSISISHSPHPFSFETVTFYSWLQAIYRKSKCILGQFICLRAHFDILSVARLYSFYTKPKLYDMPEMYSRNTATFKQTVINCCLVQLWHSFQGTQLPLADPTGHTSVQRCGPTRNCTSLGIMRCQLLAGITRLPCLTCHAPTTLSAWGRGVLLN